MRIVHYYGPALSGEFGTAIAVRGWCRALAEAGTEVALAADTERGTIRPPPGVEVIPAGSAWVGRPLPQTLRTGLAGADLVVLHGGWDPRNLPVARQAGRLDVPYIVTAHGVYHPEIFRRRKPIAKRVWWSLLERRHLSGALAVHVFFEEETEHLSARGIRTPAIVVPNGYAAPIDVHRLGNRDGYLIWLGRFAPFHKGLDLLLHAVQLLPPRDRPRLRLVGVDWRGRRKVVARLVRGLGLEQHVSVEEPLHGDAKWEALAGARGFVYPSRWEAFGVAVAEAVSIGVPTLVTPFPLGRFLASRGGAILSLPQPKALAEGLMRLTDAGADGIGRRGAEVVREHLSWDRVASSWLQQVEDLLRGS